MQGALSSWQNFLSGFFWGFSISIAQWVGLEIVYQLIDRRISWIETPVKKVFVQVISFLTYSASAFIIVQLANYYIWLGILPSESWKSIIRSLPFTLLISLVLSLIFTAIGFFFAWKNAFLQAEKLKVEMLAYKYESLRNQINPHFLFNSLNVLSDLVYDDQAMAVKFIRQLSDLFRYVLDSRDKELVPLKDELEFIRSFTFLLKTRFEEKLKIDVDVQANPEEYIVPMTLQLLIENAVKHNEVSEAFPLRISVRKVNDCLEVENNLQPKNVGDDSKKTGLKNITQQFAFFSEKPIKIITSDERYMVRVPILKSVEK
ncbi:autolysin sensor kinase [Aquipluma nitroreducens]|uniref:Autolysin sensor kinase n=2 Tax=Aquipluma nitroreducens TaxID=2010828 RepID=A0A5K7SB83_9BACT|nr:autolysin sensor kinase [Aquipluma nitroreducens]